MLSRSRSAIGRGAMFFILPMNHMEESMVVLAFAMEAHTDLLLLEDGCLQMR